jgi:hypothetical protein
MSAAAAAQKKIAQRIVLSDLSGAPSTRLPALDCPSSKHLGPLSQFSNGGFGSSWIDVKPLGADGSSGDFGWSVS